MDNIFKNYKKGTKQKQYLTDKYGFIIAKTIIRKEDVNYKIWNEILNGDIFLYSKFYIKNGVPLFLKYKVWNMIVKQKILSCGFLYEIVCKESGGFENKDVKDMSNNKELNNIKDKNNDQDTSNSKDLLCIKDISSCKDTGNITNYTKSTNSLQELSNSKHINNPKDVKNIKNLCEEKKSYDACSLSLDVNDIMVEENKKLIETDNKSVLQGSTKIKNEKDNLDLGCGTANNLKKEYLSNVDKGIKNINSNDKTCNIDKRNLNIDDLEVKLDKTSIVVTKDNRNENPFFITDDLYNILKSQISNYEHQIHVDVQRTFRQHSFFHDPYSEGQSKLFNILVAYANYNPKIGYCQGMSSFVALILMYLPELNAFNTVNFIIKYNNLESLFDDKLSKLSLIINLQTEVLQILIPKIYNKILSVCDLSVFVYSWYLTLFSRFNIELSLRVLDLLLFYDFSIFLIIVPSILRCFKKKIYDCDSESLIRLLSNMENEKVDVEKVVKYVREYGKIIDLKEYRKALGIIDC